MNIHEIRRLNLISLQENSGLPKGKFAERCDSQPAQFSQIYAGRGMGNKLARKIERELGLTENYMDVLHDSSNLDESSPAAIALRIKELSTIKGLPDNTRMVSVLSMACDTSVDEVASWFDDRPDKITNQHLLAIAKLWKAKLIWLQSGKGAMLQEGSETSLRSVVQGTEEEKGRYFADRRVERDDTRLLYIALVEADASLKSQVEMFGEDYTFYDLARSAAELFRELRNEDINIDEYIKEIRAQEQAERAKTG